eukprot:1107861-Pelagomonas_calceolata.AAC.1
MAGSALGACSFTGWLIHGSSHNSRTGWVCPEATPSNLMSVVHCGGRLSMRAYGEVKLFIELGIYEATHVGVVDAT